MTLAGHCRASCRVCFWSLNSRWYCWIQRCDCVTSVTLSTSRSALVLLKGGNILFEPTCVNIELLVSPSHAFGKANWFVGMWGTMLNGTDVTLTDGFEADVCVQTGSLAEAVLTKPFGMAPLIGWQVGQSQSRSATSWSTDTHSKWYQSAFVALDHSCVVLVTTWFTVMVTI